MSKEIFNIPGFSFCAKGIVVPGTMIDFIEALAKAADRAMADEEQSDRDLIALTDISGRLSWAMDVLDALRRAKIESWSVLANGSIIRAIAEYRDKPDEINHFIMEQLKKKDRPQRDPHVSAVIEGNLRTIKCSQRSSEIPSGPELVSIMNDGAKLFYGVVSQIRCVEQDIMGGVLAADINGRLCWAARMLAVLWKTDPNLQFDGYAPLNLHEFMIDRGYPTILLKTLNLSFSERLGEFEELLRAEEVRKLIKEAREERKSN